MNGDSNFNIFIMTETFQQEEKDGMWNSVYKSGKC